LMGLLCLAFEPTKANVFPVFQGSHAHEFGSDIGHVENYYLLVACDPVHAIFFLAKVVDVERLLDTNSFVKGDSQRSRALLQSLLVFVF
jgi:hypothetical protein